MLIKKTKDREPNSWDHSSVATNGKGSHRRTFNKDGERKFADNTPFQTVGGMAKAYEAWKEMTKGNPRPVSNYREWLGSTDPDIKTFRADWREANNK